MDHVDEAVFQWVVSRGDGAVELEMAEHAFDAVGQADRGFMGFGICRLAGLQLEGEWSSKGVSQPMKRKRRRAIGARATAPVLALPNQRWSLLCVHDQLASGRRFRCLPTHHCQHGLFATNAFCLKVPLEMCADVVDREIVKLPQLSLRRGEGAIG